MSAVDPDSPLALEKERLEIAFKGGESWVFEDSSLERLGEFLDAFPVAVISVDPTGRTTGWNRAAEELFGWRAEEVLGRPVPVVPEERRREYERRLASVVRGEPFSWFETERLRSDGSLVDVSMAAATVRGAGRGRLGALVLCTDISDRKRAEAELRGSEERYRSLFENVPLGLYRSTPEGEILDANPALAESLGYGSVEELLQTDAVDHYVNAADRDELVGGFRGKGQVRKHPLRFRRKDGSRIWVELTARAVRDGDGEIRYYQGAIQDVTRRKEVERELQLARFVVDNTEDAVFWMDGQGRFIDVNDAACDTLGYRREELLGMSVPDIDPQYGPEEVPGSLQRLKERRFSVFRSRHRREDGTEFPVEISSHYVPRPDAGDIYCSFARDITGRVEAEEQLQRLSLAIGQTVEAIVITDRDGTIEYVNPAFEEITGYGPDEAIGENPRFLKSGHHDRAFYRELWETILDGEVWSGRFVNRRKDGSTYREQATISPVRDGEGKIVSFVAVKKDITRELELQERLQLAQRLESVGRLAGGVAHDFNNLLSAVLGYSDLLLEGDNLSPRQRQDLREIKRAGEKAESLTRQLLAFGRQQVLEPTVLDLNDLVGEMARLLRRVISEDIELRIEKGSDLHRIEADPGQLEQMLMNLAVNASDAMPEGGTLTIRTANASIEESVVDRYDSIRQGPHVLLEVSDTGIGMDDETVSQAFDPFFTTKADGEGTGLGLSMVYGIVKQHGGSIWVDSRPDEGSTFAIYLRAVAAEVPEEGDPPDDAHRRFAEGGSETVLLVEDEDAVRQLARRILVEAGYRVVAHEDPRRVAEALERFDSPAHSGSEADELDLGSVDLLLLDVVMPGMSGPELADGFRQRYPEAKVLFMSGHPMRKLNGQGFDRDQGQYLQKPFSSESLRRAVRGVLD